MSGHSKAPWSFREPGVSDQSDCGAFLDADGLEICSFGDSGPYYPSEGSAPSDEDCALMIAAPELLEALTAAWHALRSYQHGNSSPKLAEEVADRAEAVISRVKGVAR